MTVRDKSFYLGNLCDALQSARNALDVLDGSRGMQCYISQSLAPVPPPEAAAHAAQMTSLLQQMESMLPQLRTLLFADREVRETLLPPPQLGEYPAQVSA